MSDVAAIVLHVASRRKGNMGLPFTRDAFLDVFALYNTSFWPVAVLLWAATAIAVAAHATGRDRTECTFGLLAVHWGWAATTIVTAGFLALPAAGITLGTCAWRRQQ